MRRLILDAEARVETLPPFLGTCLSAGLIAFFAGYGALLSGDANRFANQASAGLGFEIQTVAISGQQNVKERDILDILGLAPGLSLLSFDVKAAHQTLLREPWIESASVRKIYPGKLMIALDERAPFAIWQRGRIVSIVDEDGLVLDRFDGSQQSTLPFLVGHGAQRQGPDFLALLDEYPAIRTRVRASLLRSERRWDLLLDNGVTIKLPEDGIRSALARLEVMEAQHALLSKDVEYIDMRLSDRLVMRLSEEAMVNRLATLKQREQSLRSEKKI